MAFSTDVFPNLIDHTALMDPHGKINKIAFMLAQANDILKDMIWQVANGTDYNQVTLNTALPQGTWRSNNQGVPASKPLNQRAKFGIGMLTDYSKLDSLQARLGGELGKQRLTIDQLHIEGISQQIATTEFYGNEATNPAQFTGISPYYNYLSAYQTGANVINGGGSGSANGSIWYIGWGDSTIHNHFPNGTQAGLLYKDLGDVTPLYDSSGNRYEGYTSYFEWILGLTLMNWQYAARICNLDTTSAGLFGSTPFDIFAGMIEAAIKIPTSTHRLSGITQVDAPGDPMPGTNPAWYCNRKIRAAMDIQAIRNKNVLLNFKDYAGESVMEFRGAPVRVCDSLLNSEATIS